VCIFYSGPDKARYCVHDDASAEHVDEIEDYWNTRYLSAGEAVWHILGFNITKEELGVTLLGVHLSGSHSNQQYHRRTTNSSSMSSLNHYFCRPAHYFTHQHQRLNFSQLTYTDYFSLFCLAKFDPNYSLRPNYNLEQPNPYGQPPMHVILRSQSRPHLSRIHDIPPSHSEQFYLRTILQHRPATSFEGARTVDNNIYDSYQEAATEMGLFATQKEAEYALLEGIQTLKTPRQLRILFVHLLVNDCVPTPISLWDSPAEHLSFDHTLHRGNVQEIGINEALCEIARYLEDYGKRLGNYGLLEPTSYGREVEHEMSRWNHDPDRLAAGKRTRRVDVTYPVFTHGQLYTALS